MWRMPETHNKNLPMVMWTFRDGTGCIRRGKMPVVNVQRELLRFERQAAQKMRETKADHVLYGTKIYDKQDHLIMIEFCVQPMKDQEFYRLTGKARNVMIYALHNHCKSRYSL